MRAWFGVFLLLAAGWPLAAPAQSFDCKKARTPVERAICAQPALGALDRAVADAYAAALARPGADAAGLRAAQTAWLRGRDAGCRTVPGLAACLSAALTARVAELTPAPVPIQALTTPATPPAPLAPPAIPTEAPSQAEATLDAAVLPASSPGSTLLHVAAAGRFSLQAHSASGASLQLVDMMSGPADPAGEPGVQDGRTDVLLDAGTYKLRVASAGGATGDVGLQALPFRDAAPPAAIGAPGETVGAPLADLQQRAYWLATGPGGAIRIDAAGRALADLRLWQNGDLMPLEPVPSTIEPVRGHPMTALSLSGTVAPGTYLLVAYGGPPQPWADGDASMPFHVRSGALPRLAEGWASGTVGPLGSETFTAPSRATRYRLDLPASATATLDVDGTKAGIAPNSRAPSAFLATSANRSLVTVTGVSGQPYALRAQEMPSDTTVRAPGQYWVSAVMYGAGGEEVPPTALLLRRGGAQDGRILASTAPRVGPGTAWRTTFNLRGPTTLLLENTTSGELAVRNGTDGIGLLRVPPRSATLPDGIVEYRVSPPPGRQGVADLVFGTAPGATQAAPRWPADPVLPLGVWTVSRGESLQLDTNAGSGVSAGLLARAAPVKLAEGPLAVSQMPGAAVTIPVQVAAGGALAVADPVVGDVPVSFNPNADGVGDVVLPATDRPRTLVLAWRQPVASRAGIPAPRPRPAAAVLTPAAPRFLDLNDRASGIYALQVPEGGLYRIGTTGRLHTSVALGTAFTPTLDEAESNGPGGNALLQRWLRAGSYRVRVTAQDSAGHLGVQVAPAPLQDAPALLPGGTLRLARPAGAGLAIPLEIPEPGRYRLDLLGQDGRIITVRLDDPEGWPLTVPGPLDTGERDLPAGRLRLLLQPEATGARALARLRRVLPEPEYAGHGPHALTPETEVQATWREPAGSADPRTPDAWTFTLHGPADATITLSSGMAADLRRDGTERPVARLLGPAPFHGTLEAGHYRLEAASLGRNDRLDYSLLLATAELQPGVPRQVARDAQTPFALAEPGVVSLTSFGPLPVKAVLRDGAGEEIGRYDGREADWNIAVSRLLPAGAYRLDLAPAAPPAMRGVPAARVRETEAEAADDAPSLDDGEPSPQTTQDSHSRSTAADSADAPDQEASDGPKVELTLALPEPHPPIPAPSRAAALTGGGVHQLAVAQPAAGTLVLATAQSSVPLILTVERRRGDAWSTVALDEGSSPVIAVPADADAAPWRVQVWAVDGGALPIQAAVAMLDPSAARLDGLALQPVDGAAVPVAFGSARLDAPSAVRLLAPDSAGLLAGGWPGHALQAPEDGIAVPQEATLWVVARRAGPVSAAPVRAVPDEALALPVSAGGSVRLGGPPQAPGTLRVWRAESGLGQPGLDAGGGIGLATGSALTIGAGPVRAWNAGDADALRPRVAMLDLATLPARRLDAPLQTVLPRHSALALTLPEGARRTDLVLSPGTAGVLDGAVAWAGTGTLARSLPGSATELTLLNTGDAPAPVSVAWAPGPAAPPLRPGRVVKRFFGAAGSFDVAVDAPPGAVLRLAGDAQATFLGGDGRIVQAGGTLPGPGRLTVAHAPGPVAVWLEVPGTPAWPPATAQPQAMPALAALSGPAMTLLLSPEAPVLLHARTTAPVILTLGDAPPALFPAGAALDRYLAGPTVLRVDSAHDGPLSGTLELTADPVTPIAEGLGDPVSLAPGATAVFAFDLARPGEVGAGVRADPDRAAVRLLSAAGAVMGEGTALLRRLPAGRYLLEARLPADAPPAIIRPAVAGIAPRLSGPPPEVARTYLDLVGLTPKDAVP